MAFPIALNDIVVTNIVCTAPGQVGETNRYWRVSVILGPGPISFYDVAAQIDSDVALLYKPLLYNGASYFGVKARTVFPVSGHGWAYSKGSTGVGVAGADALPTQACGLLHFVTDWFGRSASGRLYIPFPAAADNEVNGTPVVGYQTRANALGAYLSASVTVNDPGMTSSAVLVPVVWSPTGPGPLDVTVASCRGAWATQKSRGAFGRLNSLPF